MNPPLSKKEADLWPGQKASQPGTQAPWNYYAYTYGQDKDTSVSGPNLTDEDQTEVESSKSGFSLQDTIHLLNQKEPKVSNINFKTKTISFMDGSSLSFDDAVKQTMELDKSSSKHHCPKCHSLNLEAYND